MVLRASIGKGVPNTFLRKKRKFPKSPYKTHWHYLFDQQQSLQTLKQQLILLSNSSKPSQNPTKTPPFLNCLIDSFAAYDCVPTPTAYQFLVKTLIRSSQFDELSHVISHLQNVEKFETPERVFVDLIRAYGENGMLYEAIELFFSIPGFRCVPTAKSLNSLLVILCRDRDYLRFVPNLLLKSRVMNIRIEVSSFSILINALCRIGRVDYAIKLLNFMVDDELDPGDKICSFILLSLCHQKGVSSLEVMDILDGMKKLGFCPGRADFRNVIRFLLKQGKGNEAFDVLAEMKKARIKPDITCYTMVLQGLVEEAEFQKVEDLFDEILVFGLVPDVRTYNAYIMGLCKQEKVEYAYRMIRSMKELDCEPNIVSYRTVLEAFLKADELQRVWEVWSEIKQNGIGVDMQAYKIMIEALLIEGKVTEACSLFDEMLSSGVAPSSLTVDDIISSLCHRGFVTEALQTLEKSCVRDFVPGSKAWEAILLSLNYALSYEMGSIANLANLHEE